MGDEAQAVSLSSTTDPPTRWRSGDRVLVVANPATRGNVDRIEEALVAAVPAGVQLDLRRTRAPGEGRPLALTAGEGASLLVAVGGDGTVSDVAAGAVEWGVPLAVVPGGSTNIIARELGVPANPAAAVRLIFGPHELRRIDAGVCNERIFLHMAGAGFDSRFFALTDPRLKRRLGWPAYLPAAARALREPAARVRLQVDDHTLEVTSPLVLVANGMSVIHPRLRVHRAFRADDGWIDVMVVTATRPVALARTLGRFLVTQLDRSPYVVHLRAKTVLLETDPVLPVQLDGDVVQTTPATFCIRPHALRVVIPVGEAGAR